jgi:Transposase IS4
MFLRRFEVYVGKRESQDTDQQAFDHKTGAAAVIRNMKIVLEGAPTGFCLVIIDRFYSSVALAIQLLSMFVYVVGTIQTNRIGFDKRVVERRVTRPRAIERGTFTFSRSVAVPTMVACHWWDKKPVHYLATGVAMTEDQIHRNVKGTGSLMVKCPKMITDYQRYMGGVDVHDQLRLQSYSLQMAFRFRKYYKSLFLGFMDMALVNAYITHKETCRLANTPAMTRGQWYAVLHQQLLSLKASNFDVLGDMTSTAAASRRRRTPGHELVQSNDWIMTGGVQKRRQRSCKVCGLLRGSAKKSFQTTFFCERCSVDAAKCFLCPKARREYNGVSKTCFQIWHEDFESGQSIPASLGKRVVMRRPAALTGNRVPTRREIIMADDDENEEDEDHGGSATQAPTASTATTQVLPAPTTQPSGSTTQALPSATTTDSSTPPTTHASKATRRRDKNEEDDGSATQAPTASTATTQVLPAPTTQPSGATTQALPSATTTDSSTRPTTHASKATRRRARRVGNDEDDEEETKGDTPIPQRRTRRKV